LQRVAVGFSMMQGVEARLAWQCVNGMCCSELQCVAV